jgi:hypothetical protein
MPTGLRHGTTGGKDKGSKNERSTYSLSTYVPTGPLPDIGTS